MRVVSKQEMLMKIAAGHKVKTIFNFETVKEERKEFSNIDVLPKTIRDPKQLFNKFKEICNASKNFPAALESYFYDGQISDLPGSAMKQFQMFTSFYEWSNQESTLKCSSFISILKEFNQNYRAIVRMLIDCGVELPEFIRKYAENTERIIEPPSQREIIIENKPWIIIKRKENFFLLSSPKPKNELFNRIKRSPMIPNERPRQSEIKYSVKDISGVSKYICKLSKNTEKKE